MNVVRGIIAAIFVAAVAAAGFDVARHGSPVQDAGQAVGYTAPTQGQTLLVLGDSYSYLQSDPNTPANGTTDNWGVMLSNLNRMTPAMYIKPNTGYVTGAKGKTGTTFPATAAQLLKQSTKAPSRSTLAHIPNWAIVWPAHDDYTSLATRASRSHPFDASSVIAPMKQTITDLQKVVGKGHVVVVGPVAAPHDKMKWVQALDNTEFDVAKSLGLSQYYIDPLREGWFAQDNVGFLGSDSLPSAIGQQAILYYMQTDLARDPIKFGAGSLTASSPVPPYVWTSTAFQTESTLVHTTQVQTSVSVRVQTQIVQHTVTQPPVVVTVTVPARPSSP